MSSVSRRSKAFQRVKHHASSVGPNRLPAHWHPAIEHVTVISGTFNTGTGDRLDLRKITALGSAAIIQPKTTHACQTPFCS
jgi:hypothetical protein